MPVTDLEEARSFFYQDRYAAEATGIVLEEIGEHYAKCSLKLDGRHKNALGQVMGGVMFTMADFVFAASTNFRQPPTVSTTSHISFMNPVRGTALYGESRLIKDGRRVCFYEIRITDDLGTPVAVANFCGTHLK